MSRRQDRNHRASVLILAAVGVIAAMGYGIAQSTVVTQAEWAVYMVRALNLDWNLPPNPKSNHYIERLNWRSGIEFAATSLEPGSSPAVRVDSQVDQGFIQAEGPAAEAMYRVSTIRPGEYGFRLKLANGGAVVKVGSSVFEAYQPESDFRWVDLDRVSLDPGDHTLSLLLNEGTRTQTIGVTPPCLISIEPNTGWKPLVPLTFSDLAMTVAQALDLEIGLPELGQELSIKGEEFTRLLEFPLEEGVEDEEPDPFWLSSGNNLLTAETRFDIAEPGLYTIEARYFSPKEIRWIVDGCLRVITCPVSAQGGVKRTSVVAIQLEAGSHDLTITMPPHASLDQLTVKQRDSSIEEYLGVTSDEGFKLGDADEPVSRRRAIAAAVRLRSLFDRWKAARCNDSLIALDELSALIMAAGSGDGRGQEGPVAPGAIIPGAVAQTPVDDSNNPIFPTPGGDPDVSSPTQPGQSQ